MQLAFNAPGKAPYEIFGSMPENAKAIGILLSAMGIRKSQRIEVVYPILERLVTGFDRTLQDVLFIDIGAGNGHMAAGLRSAMPELPGRIIAQDLPGMIASAPSTPAGIEVQAYDFFTEQPIKSKFAAPHLNQIVGKGGPTPLTNTGWGNGQMRELTIYDSVCIIGKTRSAFQS